MSTPTPTTAPIASVAEGEKIATTHIDSLKGGSDDEITPVVSAYAELTRNHAIFKFKRLYLNGLLVCVAAMYVYYIVSRALALTNIFPFLFDRYAGYANSVVGSIVANPGFVQYFATTTDPASGKPALNAQYVSLWGAIYSVSQILTQLVAPWSSDKFGRKLNMWLISLFIVVVSLQTAFISCTCRRAR